MNSNKTTELSFTSELRGLPATILHQLIGLLDLRDNWKSLATIVPNPDHPERLLFRTTDIAILDEQRKRPGGSPANAMIQYWSTYGRRRHTIGDVIHFLEQSNLLRAAELIRNSIDHDNVPQPQSLDTNDFFIENFEQNWTDLPGYRSMAKPTAPNESNISLTTIDDIDDDQQTTANRLIRFHYHSLQCATDNFSAKNLAEGGTKLGEGSFGEVFRCSTLLLNEASLYDTKFVAVKRFKQSTSLDGNNQALNHQEFLAELNLMYRFRHPNLVRLLGYCDDGPNLCIVTEYMENGSLYNYLFGNRSNNPSEHYRRSLSFTERLRIVTDIASAIVYLHTYDGIDKPYVHRDIKSANILLDSQLRARLADLGLVRQGSNSNMETTIVTQTVKGTSVYMAPEAFRGDVSVKVDTFSFGVVCLELWTGMAAFDSNRDESDMVSYIDEMIGEDFDQFSDFRGCSDSLIESIEQTFQQWNDDTKLNEILDPNCRHVSNRKMAKKLIILAKYCIEQRKRNRPTMIEVHQFLSHLLQDS